MAKMAFSLCCALFLIGFSAPSFSDDVIYGCVSKGSGLLRVVNKPGWCRRHEEPLSWNKAGPQGPAGVPGPIGEPGPAGTSAIGSRLSLVSSGTAVAVEGEPAVIIPGLEGVVSVAHGSNLLVQVDLREWGQLIYGGCSGFVADARGQIDLQINDTVVASREFFGDIGNLSDVLGLNLTWMSQPLLGGNYSVRVLVVARPDDGDSNLGETTSCLGSSENDGRQGRMAITELRHESPAD